MADDIAILGSKEENKIKTTKELVR